MYRALKGTKILGCLKRTVDCSCVQKENTKQKEIFYLVDLRTKQQKQSFEFWNLKTCQVHQLGIQVFDEIDNVKC